MQWMETFSCSETHAEVDSVVGIVQVTMKKDCHKKMKHAACSYKNEKNKDESADHKWAMLLTHT